MENTTMKSINAQEEKKEDVFSDDLVNFLSLAKIQIKPNLNFDTITKLDLFQCGLSTLPSSLPWDIPNLSILFCAKNNFREVPAVIGKCKKLQMVAFKSNGLTSIHPDALGPQMRWLILTDNALKSIPSTIGRCKLLQKFMLSGNQIEELPSEIEHCKSLELIRLSSNKLQNPPMILLNLPNLAWVALSDNPFLEKLKDNTNQSQNPLTLFDQDYLDDTDKGEILGSGASGVTRKYKICTDEVAVKKFAASITSDGNPEEEKRVTVMASTLDSPCLVKMLGQTKKGSIVMELLRNFQVFSQPPSMESCSRDVYPDDAKISVNQAVAITSKLLRTLNLLHQSGICHGDFYGHNVLSSREDETDIKLTDFGAAFCYDKSDEYGSLIEQIEVRAYGHLVSETSELLQKNTLCPKSKELASVLANFSEQCFSHSSQRNRFSDLMTVYESFLAKWLVKETICCDS